MAANSAAESSPPQISGLSFTQGFLLGQLSVTLLIVFFIKFFIFGETPSADERALHLASLRRQRTLAHQAAQARQRSSSLPSSLRNPLRHKRSQVVRAPPAPPTTNSILTKTYYNVDGHQPESLDWFNVLVAQAIAQLRADARDDDAVLTTLTKAMNGPGKPDWVGEIRVTEIALGEEYPIFSNCRIIPVEEGGLGSTLDGAGAGAEGGRLQARMDVDLSDVITLGVETTLLLNFPKPLSAVLPVALAVSVVRFSGTLALSFIPSIPSPPASTSENQQNTGPSNDPSKNDPSASSTRHPTTMAFTFLDDYRLDLSVRSLLGSRSRLQDVPKIAQLVEARLQAWFDERVVEPRFQQIALPSLWPRMRNTRGGDDGADIEPDADSPVAPSSGRSRKGSRAFDEAVAAAPFAAQAGAGSPGGMEARMAAEGAKIREAEERAERGRARRDVEGMRWRGVHGGLGDRERDNGDDSGAEWGRTGAMPGSMPI